MKRTLRKACKATLQQRFGLQRFRPGQKAAVRTLLSGRDLLCLLPTGAGKSLCWQIPALLQPGLTVVVSPLIALMHDQVQRLARQGVAACSLDSLMSPEERASACERLRTEECRIVFVSPERLTTPVFRDLCRRVPPQLLVVDEAHCVVQWGQDFRPAYSQIGEFVQNLPHRPVICAMTATADKNMQRQIITALGMQRPKQVVLPVLRENLCYQVRTTADRTGEIRRVLREQPGKTVIFCRTRERTERLAAFLCAGGEKAEYYHAGLARDERETVQRRVRTGETQILAATTAFGMGIDIPDVRRVIHDYLPRDAIDYLQQAGRGGRDGQMSVCLLLLDPAELLRHARDIRGRYVKQKGHPLRRKAAMDETWKPLRRMLAAALTAPCIPAALAATLGQRVPRCGCCSACVSGPLLQRLPSFPHMDGWQVRAWLLRWQRDAIAEKEQISPGEVLSTAGIRHAARTCTLPENAPEAAQGLLRLLSAMNRAEQRKKP